MSNVAGLTYGSLFAGIGGLDLGMDACGFECKWQVEINEFCSAVLAKRFPEVARFRDVRAFPPQPESVWLAHKWKERFGVDVVCAGFPCQDVSYAGRGAGLEGGRSGLYFEALRVVRLLQPRAVLLENVSALLTRGIHRVCGTLAEIGYDCEWGCVSAASVGAHHIRDRVFILAYAKRFGCDSWWGNDRDEASPWQWWRESCPGSKDVADANSEGLQGLRTEWPMAGRETAVGHTGSSSLVRAAAVERCKRLWDSEPTVGSLVDGISDRLVFRGRTAKGIPDRVEQIKALGNAVVPQVAEQVARRLMSRLKWAEQKV
jgi:DNA (cytosine-5)-methyltransferase 1